MNSVIRPSVVHYASFPEAASGRGPIAHTLGVIARDSFFHAVELGWVADPEERRRAARIAALSGLEVGYSAQVAQLARNLNLSSADEGRRRAAVAEVAGYIGEAVDLGAKAFAVLSGPDTPPEQRGHALDALARSVGELCEAAEPLGLEVWLEAFDRDLDRRMLVGPAGLAAELGERVTLEHANFGLVVDLGHIPLLGESPLEALKPVAPYLSRVHVGNCVAGDRDHPRYGDTHPPFGLPGGVNGVKELADFLDACLDVGYLKTGSPRVVSLEVRPGEGEDPELVLAASKRALVEAWGLVKSRRLSEAVAT